MKIMVGGMVQESNTFSAAVSVLADFERYYFLVGEQIAPPIKAENELNGFYKAAGEQGVTLVPTIFACAVSSGRLARSALDELKQILLDQIDQSPPCDGILFALHGAWACEDNDDADGEILTAIRLKVGPDIPIVITLDSHANVTRKMIENVNALVGYRTFPHVDFVETGYKAANLLFDIIRCESNPCVYLKKIPMILPVENQQTFRGPMAEIWKEVVNSEQLGHSLVTSLFTVQPWLDINEMGCSVVVVGHDAGVAASEAEKLALMVWNKRKEFDVALYTVPQILAIIEDKKPIGPIVISDSADSVGAGSPGDSNFVLKLLLENNAEKHLKCLLCMVDAPSARKAAEAGVGCMVRLSVGYTISSLIGSPIDIEGIVTHAGDGKFYFGGGTVVNLEGNMGCCAVVKIDGISLLLMENPVHTGDPAMYRSVGLEPNEADLVMVKSANQFRAEYDKLSSHIYILDTPGASTANLKSLQFHKIQRPMYPFDDHFI